MLSKFNSITFEGRKNLGSASDHLLSLITIFFLLKSLLWNNFRLMVKVAKRLHISPHPASLNVNILHNYSIMIKTRKLTLLFLLTVLTQISPVVPLILFSESNPVTHIAFSCHIAFSPPNWTVVLSVLTLTFLYLLIICSMSLNFGLSGVFLHDKIQVM